VIHDTRRCAECEVLFTPKRIDQRTCARPCSIRLHDKERGAVSRGNLVSRPKAKIRTSGAKECTTCHEIKSYIAYNKRAASSDGYCGSCRDCVNVNSREWYHANTERAQSNTRAWKLRTQYGLTEEQFSALLVSQGNKCAICSGEFGIGKCKPIIDHNHGTGAVRGALCIGCNTSLGHFGDNEEGLQRAVNYLRRTTTNVL
jgi:hypothetical protein